MMRMRTKGVESPPTKPSATGGVGGGGAVEWEVRPGGMLVQKRNPSDAALAPPPPPPIRVRVKHNSSTLEVVVSPQASFGELKKVLAAQTGLHPEEQKIMYRDKERESTAFLDLCGVKEKSKLVLVEDLTSHERRCLEKRRAARSEKAAKLISEISLEVDKLALQVSALDSVISKGGQAAENDVLNLIELLMTQLIRLDAVMADGDAKLQRRMQVRRVQKYVETLDMLKIHNSMSPPKLGTSKPPLAPRKQRPPAVPVVTTKWETFDSAPVPSASGFQVQQLEKIKKLNMSAVERYQDSSTKSFFLDNY